MTKTERILQALSEMGFRPATSRSTKFKAFVRPEWLVQLTVDRGFGKVADNLVFVGKSAAFRSGPNVAMSHSLDAGTTIQRWQKHFTAENPDQPVTPWKS